MTPLPSTLYSLFVDIVHVFGSSVPLFSFPTRLCRNSALYQHASSRDDVASAEITNRSTGISGGGFVASDSAAEGEGLQVGKEFGKVRVVFLTDVAGVFTRPPQQKGAELVRRITVREDGTVSLCECAHFLTIYHVSVRM
jgi:hypothetical protein